MFERITLHGKAGAVLWGYRTAVDLKSWTITKTPKGWTLTATPARVDGFLARQTPLLFTAPRDKGMWMWGIEKLEVNTLKLVAHLGPPEQ